ncbi:MAG TPA: hypothetical protein VNQ90_09470 [Chthoniobacteraceae bacterium]|nr:hypothetical protein [Chthoniobacteraceae bacterium]
MKTPSLLRHCRLFIVSSAAILATQLCASAAILHIDERFDGPGYTVGESIPNGGQNPWLFSRGVNQPAPLPIVLETPEDKYDRKPTATHAMYLLRPSGTDLSAQYRTAYAPAGLTPLVLKADTTYEWSFDYLQSSGFNIIFLDTGANRPFASLSINGSNQLAYLTDGNTGTATGSRTPARDGDNNIITVENDVWYTFSLSMQLHKGVGTDPATVDYSFSITALGADDPLFAISLTDVATAADFTSDVRMLLSPQGSVDAYMTNIRLATIPEADTAQLLLGGGLALALFLFHTRRKMA